MKFYRSYTHLGWLIVSGGKMIKASKYTIIIILTSVNLLTACSKATEPRSEPTTQVVLPTELLTAAQVTATQTLPSPTNSPRPTLADTSFPIVPTLNNQQEQAVTSIDELIGKWLAVTGPDANIVLYFLDNGLSLAGFERRELNYAEWFNFEDGIITWGPMTSWPSWPIDTTLLTWGDVISEPNTSRDCQTNTEATYEVYIVYKGAQPEKLRFVLDGEDHCIHRQTFLDGQSLTWLGREIR